jgi:hypothetical protein
MASRMLGICLASGAMLSLLFVWTTLGMLAMMGLVSATTVYAIVFTFAAVAGISLFVFATWDFKRLRKWAEEA